jgi:hypothetical protein
VWLSSSRAHHPVTRVEAAYAPDGRTVVVRGPLGPGGVLVIPVDEWLAFLDGVRNHEFDREQRSSQHRAAPLRP